MRKWCTFRRVVCLVLVGVLSCTSTSFVKASIGNNTSISSNNSDVGSGGGAGSSSTGWKFYDDDGYKMTLIHLTKYEKTFIEIHK